MSIASDRILFEDAHLLAVNKLSGELVVRGKGKVEKLPLLDFLKKDNPGLRALHRLDFETSGVVVFARKKEVSEAVITSDFSGWQKTYKAIVIGNIRRSTGVLNSQLPARGKGKVEAVTRYRVLERFGDLTLIEATIETGRHHQIRQHFARIGNPLVLDSVYGNEKANRAFTKATRFHKFFLHAASVRLPHPDSGKHITIEAPLPDAFVRILKLMRG